MFFPRCKLQECEVHRSQTHSVDHKLLPTAQVKPNHLQQIARKIRSDGQNPGRVCFGVQVDNGHGMVKSMKYLLIAVAMLPG